MTLVYEVYRLALVSLIVSIFIAFSVFEALLYFIVAIRTTAL